MTVEANGSANGAFLQEVLRVARLYQSLAERALGQVSDADLHTLIDAEANSLAIIVQHLAGNLRSRFTDFLTTDGEKPDRNRDGEFEMPAPLSREALLDRWRHAWALYLGTVEALTPADVMRTVVIRGESMSVLEALSRSVTHIAYHVGQIALLGKHFAGADWASLSIPKRRTGGSPGGRPTS